MISLPTKTPKYVKSCHNGKQKLHVGCESEEINGTMYV